MKKELFQVNTSEIERLFRRTNDIVYLILSDIAQYYKAEFIHHKIYFALSHKKIYFVDNKRFYFVNSPNMKKANKSIREKLNRNVKIKNELKTLDTLLALANKFEIFGNKKISKIDKYLFLYDGLTLISAQLDIFHSHIFIENYSSTKIGDNNCLQIDNLENYQKFATFVKEINLISRINEEINSDFIFNDQNEILLEYKYKTLEKYDLSNIDFDYKNISGLNISKNPEVHINFSKIEKDISDCNFNGYDLKKQTFRDFNIKNTDFRNTKATIDIATCKIAKEGKMCSGTLFDEENKFVFGDKPLTINQAKDLGIKIFMKEK